MQLSLIKGSEKGKTFQADGFQVVYRYKGSVSGDNQTNPAEFVYLVSGKAEITIKEHTEVVEAPAKITISAKTYHKILAQTDLVFLLFYPHGI
jgi:predicted RNA binding protein YcfA (HicA-like mRNA interferase family)